VPISKAYMYYQAGTPK